MTTYFEERVQLFREGLPPKEHEDDTRGIYICETDDFGGDPIWVIQRDDDRPGFEFDSEVVRLLRNLLYNEPWLEFNACPDCKGSGVFLYNEVFTTQTEIQGCERCQCSTEAAVEFVNTLVYSDTLPVLHGYIGLRAEPVAEPEAAVVAEPVAKPLSEEQALWRVLESIRPRIDQVNTDALNAREGERVTSDVNLKRIVSHLVVAIGKALLGPDESMFRQRLDEVEYYDLELNMAIQRPVHRGVFRVEPVEPEKLDSPWRIVVINCDGKAPLVSTHRSKDHALHELDSLMERCEAK